MSDELTAAFQDLYRDPYGFNWVRVDVLAKKLAAMERVIKDVLMLPVEDALRDYDEDAQMRLSASIRAFHAINTRKGEKEKK